MVTQKSDRGMMFQCSGPSRAPRLPRGFIWGSKYVFFGTLRFVFSIFSRCLHTEFMSSSDSKQWLPRLPRGFIWDPKCGFSWYSEVCFRDNFIVFKCMIHVKFTFEVSVFVSPMCVFVYSSWSNLCSIQVFSGIDFWACRCGLPAPANPS